MTKRAGNAQQINVLRERKRVAKGMSLLITMLCVR
jgi:hypothetical protein